jgi:hypothetical protein
MRDLTGKQKKFVEAVLAGHSKCAAYRLAYSPPASSPKTIARNAVRTSQSRAVREELDRQTLLSLPQGFDSGVLLGHALAVLKELSENATASVRLKAAMALIQIADALDALQSEPNSSEPERTLEKLREVYRKAQTIVNRYSPEFPLTPVPEQSATVRPAPSVDQQEDDEYSVPEEGNGRNGGGSPKDGCEVLQEPGKDVPSMDADLRAPSAENCSRFEWRLRPVAGAFPRRMRRELVRVG